MYIVVALQSNWPGQAEYRDAEFRAKGRHLECNHECIFMLSLSHSRNSVRASLHGRRLSTLSMPLGVSTWIDGITRRNPSFATERVNSERIAQLERTLPTRVGPSSLGLKSHGPGDELHRAHHLVLFQPRTSLDNLGEDGSSTVSIVINAECVKTRNTTHQLHTFDVCGLEVVSPGMNLIR